MKKNILFKQQYKFEECKYINQLPFDFYLPNYNICIEYDGEQHFKSVKHWGGEIGLKNIQNRDKIKNKYCENNNIKLLRIKYDDDINHQLKNNIEYD